VLARNPFLRDSLLLGVGGERIISKVVPSYVYNTVDQPIFPTNGKRFTTSIDLAGLGGNTNFYKPMSKGLVHQAEQSSDAGDACAGGIHPSVQRSKDLPIFQKLFLGGEYSIRGFRHPDVGPQDPVTGLVLGGNKSLLFNLEEQITIAGPVRLIAFYDAARCSPDRCCRDRRPTCPTAAASRPLSSRTGFNWRDFQDLDRARGALLHARAQRAVPAHFCLQSQRGGVLDNTLLPRRHFSSGSRSDRRSDA